MSVHTMRLVLGVMFLILAGVILTRDWFMPGLGAGFDPLRLSLGGVLALVFGCLNMAKWYVVWSYRHEMATPVRTPFQADPSLVKPEPPNPELDFTRQPDESVNNGEPR
ncbi:MAG: hypothetical protein C0467_00615 [Planctomycetaceae bacterium]|nr:hypothetical protein [Planctomycetaceae bacterium]